MKKRKPWRNFRKHRASNRLISFLCLLILLAELIIFSTNHLLPVPSIEISEHNEVIIYQFHDGSEKPDNKIYGIRIRLKEGIIDFYRQSYLNVE